MNGQTEKKDHEWCVKARREMTVSGVKEVESFDETGIVLLTVGGEMTVEGSGMKIDVLDMDRGVVSCTGRIDGVFYSSEEREAKGSFLKRLFR